ncbi:MAG: enoyl-CoA hydratase/isomerase family protein [Desulfobacteraceae bacterium]|nr:enoyl-CoA hydratase/isomerase family protein [Desulfobacteraceae bacterium]
MALFELTKNEGVAIVNMANGANKQNLEFAEGLNQLFDEILADNDIYSIVITSSDEKNFSQGVDIEWLMQRFEQKDFDSIKAFMYATNNVFKRLLLMPVPVIAAINGHAFGNGAMLACACDFRFMKKDRGYFCFPEVDISIPFLPGMIAFVRKAIPEYKFNEYKLTGKKVGAQELFEHHVIEKACEDQEELMKDTLSFAKTFKKSRNIFSEHKKRMYKAVIEVIDTQDPEFIDSLNLFVS